MHEIVQTPEEIAAAQKEAMRSMVRQKIARDAGDQQALLGTASDTATLAIYGLAVLVSKLATADSLADVRAAAEPFEALSASFLAKVEGEEVQLPFMQKGIETVVSDIETRATAVSGALNSNINGD